jgi:hypothetical protein
MSGVKDSFVQLRQSELDRLRENCRRVDNLQSSVADRVRENQRLQQQMDNQRRQEEQRQRQFDSQISNMSQQMRDAEKANQQQLNQLRDQFNTSLQGVNQRINQLQINLQQQGQNLQNQITNLSNQIAAKEADQAKRANIWLQDTKALLDAIDAGYEHEKFMPGVLSSLRSQLSLTQSNIQQGDYQAAIASAQQTFLAGQQLRLDLEQLTLEWNAYLKAAQENVAEVLALCDANFSAQFTFSTEEGAETINAEIDFWTEGKLTELRQQVATQHQRLDKPDSLTLAEIKQIIADSQQYRQQSETLTEEAREKIIASQIRQNIGQIIESSLADMGFEVTDAVWEETDYRRALHVKLENPAGDQMVTIIKPTQQGNKTGYHITTHLFDESSNDEEFRLERLNSMLGKLREEGLECGPLTCAEGTENRSSTETERLNFEQVKARQQQTA